MGKEAADDMLTLVDRKPLNTTSARRLREESGLLLPYSRGDYALEMTVACTRRRDKSCHEAKPFAALLDTGFTGKAVISLWHYEYYCGLPQPVEELVPAELEYFDAREAEGARFWQGHLWLHPGGVAPQIDRPVKVARGKGIIIVPPKANDACVGMWAFHALGAQLKIDYYKEVFSILIPRTRIDPR